MRDSEMFKRNMGFIFATLVIMAMWCSYGIAKETHSIQDDGVKQSMVNDMKKPEAVKKEVTDDAVKIPNTLDIDLINEIRLKKDKATDRLKKAQNRRKMRNQRQLSKIKEQIRSQSFHKSIDRRKIPDVENPFKIVRKSSRESKTSFIYPRTIIEGAADSIYVRVNGVDADTITQGDDFVVTVHFPSGTNEADISFWVDMNANGTWEDTVDFDVDEERGHIVDNGPEDEDSTVGVYQMTFWGDEEGPGMVGNLRVLFVAEDTSSSDDAYLYVEPDTTDYSVSGTIDTALANIIVMAFPLQWMGPDTDGMDPGNDGDHDRGPKPWMTVTDTLGHYQNFLPDSGNWAIFSFDFLGVTGGWFPDTAYFDVHVDGHLTGFDFNYIPPDAWVEGVVTDEQDNPLEGVVVWAEHGRGPGVWTETDSTGYYILGLLEGGWWVGLDEEDLIPEYLVPWDEHAFIGEGDTVAMDFVAYVTDETISGTVFLNDYPIGDVGVGADCIFGWTETWSEFNSLGSYTLSVASAADDEGGYSVYAWDLPPDVVVDEYYDEIRSGSMGIDFHLYSVFGGIEGIVRDVLTQDPISDAWVGAWDGEDWYGTGTGPDGFYHLALPNGTYEVHAGAEGYYPQMVGNVSISDNFVVLDIALEEVTFDGSFSGYVYDAETDSPLVEADVSVWSEEYWNHTFTDTAGFYYFDLPNGEYWAGAWKDGYAWVDTEFVIENNEIEHDFYLEPIVIDAVIEGVVIDSSTNEPIIGAWVSAGSPQFWVETVTGPEGYFYFDVPSDTFWVDAYAEGYHPEFGIEVYVASEDTAWLDIGLWPMMIKPPFIYSVMDVPHDQGRQVRITWFSGDPAEWGVWTEFSIWRLAGGRDQPMEHPVWDFITTVPFHGIEDYAYVAPTLVDSNATTGPMDKYWSVFRVTAHTWDPWVFFDSEPMKGYSVDNLRPMVPGGLLAIGGDDAITLSWLPNAEEDLDYYTIYRGTTSGFEPDNPFDYTIDTLYVDTEVVPGMTYYYVITATDFNGNESGYTDEVGGTLSLDDDIQIPTKFELAQNFPNPFNPVTTIRYGLPAHSNVTIVIYDALGRKVKTLVQQYQEIGYHTVNWNGKDENGRAVASGIYFFQINAHSTSSSGGIGVTTDGDFVQTRKMILLR